MSSSLQQLFDLAFVIFIVPGNFLAVTMAGFAATFTDVHSDGVLFADNGSLARGISAVFWAVVIIELWFLHRYSMAIYREVSCACYVYAERVRRIMSRYRIINACREAAGATAISADSTIVEELVALEDLAMEALRLARDQGTNADATIEQLKRMSGASSRDIRRVFKQLEHLQFITRESAEWSAKARYRLTLTGGLYLRACEP